MSNKDCPANKYLFAHYLKAARSQLKRGGLPSKGENAMLRKQIQNKIGKMIDPVVIGPVLDDIKGCGNQRVVVSVAVCTHG